MFIRILFVLTSGLARASKSIPDSVQSTQYGISNQYQYSTILL